MSTEGLSNLVALETIWKLGFSIVAKRIGEWLDTKGVKHNFETVDVPPGTRINHLRTDFRRRWERLPVEWQLPEIGQMVGFKVGEYVDPETGETKDKIGEEAFLPWAINGADLGWENYIDAYVSERGRQSQTAEWYDENVRQSLEESYRWWIGFFQHFKAKLSPKRMTRRRRRPERNSQATARQAEVIRVVAECNGNQSEAARRLRISKAAVSKHLKKADSSLTGLIRTAKGKTVSLSRDRRGQVDLAFEDDRRRL